MKNNIGMNFGNPERHDPADLFPTLQSRNQCYFGHFPGLSHLELARLSRREDGAYSAFVTASCKKEEEQRILDEFAAAIP